MGEEWFATHAAGFGPLVARLALRDCPGASTRADGDNALRLSFGGGAGRGAAPKALLAYCRGLFRVLGEAPGGLERASRSIAASGRLDSPHPGSRDPARNKGMPRTFVLRSFGPDDPAAIPADARHGIEALIARATGMRPDSGRPEREYRLQERSDGATLFLEKAAIAGEAGREGDRAGELPSTTCRLLAEMTSPWPDDVFLDPFCGYGGIVLERALAGPYRFAFASDADAGKVAAVKAALSAKAFEKRRRTIFPKVRDALDASGFDAGFVTAIATDPPWGLYEAGMGGEEADTLLRAFLAEAGRLLAAGGRLVLLVARSFDAEAAAGAVADFRPGGAAEERGRSRSAFLLRESFEVLVSGKKARALRFDRV
jgi:predicted RNA methylase